MTGKLKSDVGIVQAESRRVGEGVSESDCTMGIHDNPLLGKSGAVSWMDNLLAMEKLLLLMPLDCGRAVGKGRE